MNEPAPNALRFKGKPGHVESTFVRANDPERPRALWLKQTILAPLEGAAVAESWLVWFDGERGVTLAERTTQPWAEARFADASLATRTMRMTLGEVGGAQGAIVAPEGPVRFELSWRVPDSGAARPLAILPWKILRMGPFPRSKLLTPFPFLRVSGVVELPGEKVSLEGWHGMQGHNWGKEHSAEYAWGQCLFPESDAMLEGFTARVKVAGCTTPRLSALVVRRGVREYRFDRIFDPWRQEATLEQTRWSVRLRSDDGDAELTMDAAGRPMACLGYANPSGELRYCLNSKLAAVECLVRPSDGASFRLTSAHGGALEFLRRDRDPLCPRVV